MKTRELILVLIIVGYLLAIFSIQVIEMSSQYEKNKDRPIPMVELFGNGTTRSFEIENPPGDFNLSIVISAVFMRLSFAFPFAIAGIGLLSFPIGFIQNGFTIRPEAFIPSIFWIIAMITIPINYIFTKNFSKWYRIPYIYVIAALIAGTPMLLNENFGQ